MKYLIFKLIFNTAVHFGNGRLDSTGMTFYADTLFSALFKEALEINGIDYANELYNRANNGELVLSDAMPYCGDDLYIPKPVLHIEGKEDGNSVVKKKFKNLNYICVDDLDDFINGEYEPFDLKFGKSKIQAKVNVKQDTDNEPYNVGVYKFDDECGLYFIAKIAEDYVKDFKIIMDSLSYKGIGGKVSSGLGSFKYTTEPVLFEDRLKKNTGNCMTLSVSMAKENELNKALDEASYSLVKRSGFVASYTYNKDNGNFLKKNDFYCFKSGSCFKNRFDGNIFDVSCNGAHAVYRYAKPIFISL